MLPPSNLVPPLVEENGGLFGPNLSFSVNQITWALLSVEAAQPCSGVGENRQYQKIGNSKNGNSVFSVFVDTSFDIFVVTYRVTKLFAKTHRHTIIFYTLLFSTGKKRLNLFPFLVFPYFRVMPGESASTTTTTAMTMTIRAG